MHLILTGATGLVGSAVLHHMLTTPSITRISILSRRPVPQAANNPKATVHILSDFTSYPPDLLAQLRGARGVVWAQGISASQVSKEEYRVITYDYPLAAARAFAGLNDEGEEGNKGFNFVYVSGEGATTTPGRLTPFFGIVKGETEAALLSMTQSKSPSPSYPDFHPYSLRPGGVDASAHPEIHEYIPERKGMLKALEVAALPVFRVVAKGMMSPTRELAAVLTGLAMGDGEPLAEGKGVEGEGRTVRNEAMRRLAGI